ncbi:MAG: hypothetical protein NTX28_18245 [Novosphingobium sp.]|nr:hypothetical protein [Novosphingobium sp.]
MSRHYLLVAVLDEMDRVASKLRHIVEDRPEDWEDDYATYRRQLGLCFTEMVKLAENDLGMRKEDARVLRTTFDFCRAKLARHQARYPIESLVLHEREFIESFNQIHAGFLEFKSMMLELVERYQMEPEEIT